MGAVQSGASGQPRRRPFHITAAQLGAKLENVTFINNKLSEIHLNYGGCADRRVTKEKSERPRVFQQLRRRMKTTPLMTKSSIVKVSDQENMPRLQLDDSKYENVTRRRDKIEREYSSTGSDLATTRYSTYVVRPTSTSAPRPLSYTPQQRRNTLKRTTIQASTSELLVCLDNFVRRSATQLPLESGDVIAWLKRVDRQLTSQGWQDTPFVNPSNLIFVYLLVKHQMDEVTFHTAGALRANVLTCLYVSYAYMGNEISYPMKPFLVEPSREAFWKRTLHVIGLMSGDMLRLNADTAFFAETFAELKSHQSGSGMSRSEYIGPGEY